MISIDGIESDAVVVANIQWNSGKIRKYPTGRKVEKVNVPSDAFSACYSRTERKHTVVNEIENLRWINSEIGQKNTERRRIRPGDKYTIFKALTRHFAR